MNRVAITVGVSQRLFRIFLAAITLFAMSISVWAQKQSSETISATINLSKAAKVGNTQLPAGTYKVTANSSQAKFQQGSKVVAQVPCTLMELSFASKDTQVSSDDNGRISEIQVAGKRKAIEFSS